MTDKLPLVDRAMTEPTETDWVQAGYSYAGGTDGVGRGARRRIVLAVARVLLEEPPSQEMMEAGISWLGSDDERSSAEITLDEWLSMSRALLAELQPKEPPA